MIIAESTLSGIPGKAAPHRISAASLHAARTVMQCFDITVKPDTGVPNLRADVRCLAILIDITTNVYRAAQLRPELRYWQERLRAGTATATDINKFLRKIGIELEYLPNYEDREEEVKVVLPG
jgi:hypothetical protein